MPDLTSLNDPELDGLQERLAGVLWSPPPHQREQLLYSCGRAAGRAERDRHLRRIYVIMASLSCLLIGLSVVLLTGGRLRSSGPNSIEPTIVETLPVETQIEPLSPEITWSHDERNDRQSLTASSSYEQLLALERDIAGKFSLDSAAEQSSPPVLTPLGRSHLDELWN